MMARNQRANASLQRYDSYGLWLGAECAICTLGVIAQRFANFVPGKRRDTFQFFSETS